MSDRRKKTATRRVVRLFMNGRSQALRIPREWRLPGHEAAIRKKGRQLIIEPAKARPKATKKSLLEILDGLPPLGPEDQFPQIEDRPPEPFEP
jgi:antitoxin VapB